MFKVVSQLPVVIWPSMTLMLAPLVFVSWPRLSPLRPGAVGNLLEVNTRGRGMFEINKYKCIFSGVDHES